MYTEYQKLLAGEWFDPQDKALRELRLQARKLTQQFNKTQAEQHNVRRRLQHELFAVVGEQVFIEPPFYCDYGRHIHFGQQVFLNFNCTILDVASVTFGNHIFVGPNVQFYTVNHPLKAEDRRSGLECALPITIGDDVWIGGAAIICPGVTIGNRAVIAAGAVVTRNVPADTLVAGNPARVIRSLAAAD